MSRISKTCLFVLSSTTLLLNAQNALLPTETLTTPTELRAPASTNLPAAQPASEQALFLSGTSIPELNINLAPIAITTTVAPISEQQTPTIALITAPIVTDTKILIAETIISQTIQAIQSTVATQTLAPMLPVMTLPAPITTTTQPQRDAQAIPAPVQPAVSAKVTQTKKPLSTVDFSDIDNLDEQDSGNWYIKRVLLKKAGPKHNKIRQKVVALSDLKNVFFDKKNVLEKDLNQFYVDLGFKKAVVERELEQLNKEIEVERHKEGLTAQERTLLEELNQKKKELEELNKNLNTVKDLDANLNQAISKLLEQIDIARGYETKAWQYYEGIADVLDDQKARNYYQQIEVILDNIEAIEKYVEAQFTPYVDQSLTNLKNLMVTIKLQAETLKDKGIALKEQFDTVQNVEDETRAALERQKAAKEKAAKAAKGFFGNIWESISNFFVSVWETISWPFKWMLGYTSPKPAVSKVASRAAELKITST